MNTLRFKFDEQKLIQALAFFSMNGVRDLTKMKASKLLFFADKKHLLEYARPIIGDSYACMQLGPIPSIALNEMAEAVETQHEIANQEEPLFAKVLGVDRSGTYPTFFLKDASLFDADVFSKSDLHVLSEVLEQYGQMTALALSDLSHKEECWKLANVARPSGSSVDMPYETFFDSEHKNVLHLAQQDQAEDDELKELFFSVNS